MTVRVPSILLPTQSLMIRRSPYPKGSNISIHLFEFHSLTTNARDDRNASSTGKYWLIKVFEVLKHYQDDIILSGTITLDETFFTETESKKILKPDGKEYRGISRNKLCVASGKDDKGHTVLICEYTSKPSLESTFKALGSRIKKGSALIHDSERSHSVLIEKLDLKCIVYDADKIKDLPDNKNPLDPINKIHSLSKRFMRAHGGFNRDNLQGFMNLISFILNDPKDRYEKADLFINMALSLPKRVKYREVMPKKDSK